MNPLLLLRLVPSGAWWGCAILVAIGAMYSGHVIDVRTHEKAARLAGRAEVQAKWDAQAELQRMTAAKTDQAFRAQERTLQAQVTSAQEKYDALQSQHAAAVAAVAATRADNSRLRNQLSAYASGGGSAADDSVSACRERAGAIGDVLAGALQTDAEHAIAAETCGDSLRSVLTAWPTAAHPTTETPTGRPSIE